MGYLTTRHNEFQEIQQNFDSTAGGASVTPGVSHSMGSWTDLLGGTVNEDTYGIFIEVVDGEAAGISTMTLADIGIDESGGTSYRVLIPYLHCSAANNYNGTQSPSYQYYFPLFIPAGSRIACRAQGKPNPAQAFTVRVTLLQKPSHPEYVKVGSYVEAVGIDQSLSRGTLITCGASEVEGAWQSLGTLSHEGWYFQMSCGWDDSAYSTRTYLCDLAVGDASNKRMLAEDVRAGTGSSDAAFPYWPPSFCYATLPAGSEIFARALCNNTPDSNMFAMAYVVGGH